MTLSEFLNNFDKLIVENTQGAAANTLRHYLVTMREHVEAFETNYARLESDYSTLEKEHTESKAYAEQSIADLEEENSDLEIRLAACEQKKPKDLNEDTIKVLRVFFEREEPLTAEDIAFLGDMKLGLAKYHCEQLIGREFLWLSTVAWADQPMPYSITDKGRAYLVENSLV
jgi:hypothetical protein